MASTTDQENKMDQRKSGRTAIVGLGVGLGWSLAKRFAVPKFGTRALAQSMARELGPKGIASTFDLDLRPLVERF